MGFFHQKNFFLTLLFISITTIGLCQGTSPVANFQLSADKGCAPFTVSVTNTSSNANQYSWGFGNGNSSSLVQPSIVFASKGVFDVRLIAKDTAGNADTLVKTVLVNEIPTADFSYVVKSMCLNQNQISFTNHSTQGLNYTWDFGDGNSSTLSNPTYSYADSGNYRVKLIVSDSIGCSSFKQANQVIRIEKTPELEFTVSDTLGCDTSQQFSFNCPTDSIANWLWDFGDGTTSNTQNPSHTYSSKGVYNIKLITTNQFNCLDTLEKLNYINVYKEPHLDFSSSLTSGCRPLNVSFYNDSTNKGSSLSWSFGDGRRLNSDSITTTFDSSGSYSITLISSYQNGCIDSITKPNFIQVNGDSKPSFTTDSMRLCKGGSIKFRNTSLGGNSCTFNWNFGDSVRSTAKNPSHTYNQTGSYTVTLTATDSNSCSSTYSKTIDINKTRASFSVDKTSGCLPLTVNFKNHSTIADKWFWDFGDGDTSHQISPSHTYYSSGKFDVSLVIETNSGCLDSIVHHDFIHVFDDTISTNLSDTITGCLPLPIDFSDNQLGAVEWQWDFGNGDTSMAKAPSYTYQSPGTFTISLKTLNSNGCPIYFENYAIIKIDSIEPKISTLQFDCSNTTIQLTDSTENISSWLWNFGDGTYSTLQSPVHKFPDTLVYNISLTLISNNGCSRSVYLPSYIDFTNCLAGGQGPGSFNGGTSPPNNADSINSNTIFAQNCAPQIVQLTNPDTNAFAWNWSFGDGDSSSVEHPIHVYRTPGVFDVQLITEDSVGKDTILWNDYITVSGPTSNFTSSISYDCDSASVSFNNTSIGTSSWIWRFADVYDSSSITLTHKYPYSNRNYPIQLIVNDSMGCSSSKMKILNFPKNEISFDLPDSACIGDSIFFSASDTSARYFWDFGDGTTDSSLTAIHNYSQGGTYPIQVISKNAMGCESIHTLGSIEIKGANAQFQLIDSVGCINEYYTFKPSDLSADSYHWNIGNIHSSRLQLSSFKLANPGSYKISLTTEKEGCQNTFTHPTAVQVNGVKANFSIDQLTNCYPIQAVIEDTNSNSSQWEWIIENDTIHNSNQYTFNTQDSSINISLKVTAKNGCVDSTSKLFTPTVLSSNFELSDTVGCAPLSVKFTNKAKRFVSSHWSFGDGDTSTVNDPTHVYDHEGVYSVRLITRSIDGCIDTTIYKNAIRVSSIQAKYSTTFNSTCAPMMVNFENKSINATAWNWSFGDGSTSTAKNPFKIYNNSGGFDISLIVSNNIGCSDTLLNRKEITVPGPITKFSVSDSVVCGIKPLQFNDSSLNAVEWSWFFGDGSTSQQQNPSHTYLAKGKYSAMLTTKDSSGCEGFFTLPEKIKMDYIPKADFSIKDTIGCTPFKVDIYSRSSNVSKWKWDMGNGVVKSDSLSSYTYNNAGSYSISLSVENSAGCKDSIRFDSIIALQTPKATVETVDPLCNNEQPIVLKAKKEGGKWFGKGITDSNIGNYAPRKANVGIDTVLYSFQGSCPVSDTVFIEIKEAPEVDFVVDKMEGCYDLEATFETVYLKPLSFNLIPTYTWKQNGIEFSDSSTVTKSFGPGRYDISLNVKTSNGCSEELIKKQLINVFDSIPHKTNIERVSVLNDGEVLIEWDKNTDIAFSEHILYRKSSLDGSFEAIKTFTNPDQTSFVDKKLNTLDSTYCYKIIAVDKCDQKLKLSEASFHCTINISANKEDKNSVKIKWSEYIGCNVSSYEILRCGKSMSNPEVIAKVNSKQLSFIDTSAYCNYQYSYRVKALGPAGLIKGSFSDTSIAKMKGVSELQKSEIIRATVEENNAVLIEWEPVKVAPEFATGYVIYRSLDNKEFSPLTFVSKDYTSYTDQTTSVMKEQYFYQIEVINTCENKNEVTNTGSSILLEATQLDDKKGKLNWTDYVKWNNGTKSYEIQRLNEFNQWETIQVVPANIREIIVNF
ncbi:MAG: PKD domain-containing protein [Vicingaceae bacterium]